MHLKLSHRITGSSQPTYSLPTPLASIEVTWEAPLLSILQLSYSTYPLASVETQLTMADR